MELIVVFWIVDTFQIALDQISYINLASGF